MRRRSRYLRPYTTCDRTGQNVPYEDTALEWTGLRVKKTWLDARHPQDFIRTIKERQLLAGQKYITSTIPENNLNIDILGAGNGNYLVTDLGQPILINFVL